MGSATGGGVTSAINALTSPSAKRGPRLASPLWLPAASTAYKLTRYTLSSAASTSPAAQSAGVGDARLEGRTWSPVVRENAQLAAGVCVASPSLMAMEHRENSAPSSLVSSK